MFQQNKLYFLLVITLCFQSCNIDSKSNKEIINTNGLEREILKKTNVEFRNQIFKMQFDTISNWALNNIQFYKFDSTKVGFQLDSLICVNKNSDKLINVKKGRTLTKNGKLDSIEYFYGVKIKEKWYYFGGPIIYITKSEKEIGKPTSFEKLHEITMKEVYSGYLKENKKTGKWEINEAFFADMTSGAYGGGPNGPKTQEEWDKVYLQIVADKWKAPRDTTNYERLRAEEMKNK